MTFKAVAVDTSRAANDYCDNMPCCTVPSTVVLFWYHVTDAIIPSIFYLPPTAALQRIETVIHLAAYQIHLALDPFCPLQARYVIRFLPCCREAGGCNEGHGYYCGQAPGEGPAKPGCQNCRHLYHPMVHNLV